MDEKKRKSSRSFELEKGGKRSFDLTKTSVRNFDLTKESNEVGLEELKKELLADGMIDAEEVNQLRELLYADGKIDQEEADFLFELNDAVSGKPNDSSWNQFFVEAISDYLLKDEKSPGVIDDEEGKWLVEKIGADGQVDGLEKQLLDHLKKNAKKMPVAVTSLMARAIAANATPSAEENLQQLKKEIIADGKIDKDEVKRLRKMLYADGKIDQEEADFIFEINDAVSGKRNDPTWNQFFVQVISDYLLKDEKSPGVIDDEEGKWLVEKIGADGQVDGVEKQLLNHLKKNAKKMPATVTALLTNTPDPEAPDYQSKSGKGKMAAAVLAGLLVLGGGGYYLLQKGDSDTEPTERIVAQGEPQTDQGASAMAMAPEPQDGEDGMGIVDPENVEDENISPNPAATEEDENVSLNPATPEDDGVVESPANNDNGNEERLNPNPLAVSKGNPEKRIDQSPSTPTGAVEQEALNVIRGDYGNGSVRKQRLGSRYDEIQGKVNEMYRTGKVY